MSGGGWLCGGTKFLHHATWARALCVGMGWHQPYTSSIWIPLSVMSRFLCLTACTRLANSQSSASLSESLCDSRCDHITNSCSSSNLEGACHLRRHRLESKTQRFITGCWCLRALTCFRLAFQAWYRPCSVAVQLSQQPFSLLTVRRDMPFVS
eukprot:5360394-Amphidinium_carterae.1